MVYEYVLSTYILLKHFGNKRSIENVVEITSLRQLIATFGSLHIYSERYTPVLLFLVLHNAS